MIRKSLAVCFLFAMCCMMLTGCSVLYRYEKETDRGVTVEYGVLGTEDGPGFPILIYRNTTVGATTEDQHGRAKPVVVKMDPPNGASGVSPRLKELRIEFNVPMGGGFSWTGGGENFPTIAKGKKPKWSRNRKTCTLPVQLKPNWSYRLGLNSRSHKNFSSAAGVALDPVRYTFSTGP